VVGILKPSPGSPGKGDRLGIGSSGSSEPTTAVGLFAIPAVRMFNYLTGRVEAFDVEMDNSSMRNGSILSRKPRSGAGSEYRQRLTMSC